MPLHILSSPRSRRSGSTSRRSPAGERDRKRHYNDRRARGGDVDQAVSLIRAGALCDLVLLSADSGSGLVRLAVSAVRKVVHEEVPVVVALEGKGENEGGSGSAGAQVDLTLVHIAIRCGADGLLLRPIGREFLVNAWQHCLRRGPLFFERKLARTPPSAGRAPTSGSRSPSMNPVPGCFPGEARMSSLTGPVGMRPGEDLFRRELLRARARRPAAVEVRQARMVRVAGRIAARLVAASALSREDKGDEEETLCGRSDDVRDAGYCDETRAKGWLAVLPGPR